MLQLLCELLRVAKTLSRHGSTRTTP